MFGVFGGTVCDDDDGTIDEMGDGEGGRFAL